MSTHANRVKMTVTSVASSGTGDITLNAASTGYRSFATAYSNANATVDILITEGTAWEIARNCTYTHSGTTVSRGTLENSSTGSAVAFNTSGTGVVVSVIAAAEFGNNAEMAIQAVTPGGRLTTESGVPVSTSDRTAQSTLYYTPFVHNIINLWDGSQWKPITFTEHTVTGAALTGLTSGKPYDVFAYLSGSALATELLVWTNDTTRATAVTLQDGRYCKSGDKTRLLLGTIYTTGTTTTEDSLTKRLICNIYNTIARSMFKATVASHTYSSATRRYWNNDVANRLETVVSISGGMILRGQNDMTGTAGARFEVNIDGTSIGSIDTGIVVVAVSAVSNNSYQAPGVGVVSLPAGFHFAAAVELCTSGTATFDYLNFVGQITC